MDLDLAGKRVLVTGASSGIGLAIVEAFLAEGAGVVAVSRKSTPELEGTGATFLSVDLSTPDGPRRMVEEVLAANPRLDVLVNNVGGGEASDADIADPFGGAAETWERALGLNLRSAVEATRAALPALVRSRGAVVNTSSSAARDPRGVPVSYAAAKAALNAFSRGLAEKVAEHGVRVNTVSPGSVRTPMITGAGGYMSRVAAVMGVDHDALVADIPSQTGMLTGALIEPAEIARTVLLLASPTMPSAVGANWVVDGGLLRTP
ncbi:NAD(P)-dependent dehydrogenase (short-subunit alcohol dehydrogenase family) [Crossiella equi]|uniref:NAD(P)-dependent dehydrogenase (Short-subunit alcohol dehydrogenase family) n=1 Tax=Crossiella equi TaxID=130796 RepID=A0ABS5A6H4_9PSEU|nr:SDR family NAD(P)-dependent oxidoreductase [Crossiella equi]MBP2472198.1 NAD(P)-dependent dehydrogenase (short-subunit alcohol dehydrogenase family) [Crossiella equi]